MRKKDMLTKQECIWLRDLLKIEIIRITEEYVASNEHPILKIRIDNLEAVKQKLINQITYQPKKRAKAGDNE